MIVTFQFQDNSKAFLPSIHIREESFLYMPIMYLHGRFDINDNTFIESASFLTKKDKERNIDISTPEQLSPYILKMVLVCGREKNNPKLVYDTFSKHRLHYAKYLDLLDRNPLVQKLIQAQNAFLSGNRIRK